jgi:hypothetical protein
MNKKNMQDKMIQIISLLNDLHIVERIEIIERIGKRLRRANSIESAREVANFRKKGERIKKENES